MFTGFSSENTPAIQVWDLFGIQAGVSAVNRVALADDCAPIQYFKTGGNTTAIQLFLPTAPIEGKQITIVNANYTSTNQLIDVYSSDANATGASNAFISIGSGQTYTLCYSKNFILVNTGGQFRTGWISLNQSPISAFAFNSIVLGGNNNSAIASRSAVVGGSVNTASGQSSAVAGGSSNTASNTNSAVVGGQNHSANSLNSSIVGGSYCSATGSSAGVFAANNGSASAASSVVLGGSVGFTRSIIGYLVTPASVTPVGGNAGNQQLGTLLLGRQTTDATTTVIRSNTSAASTTNQVILPDNSAYAFQGIVIANVTGAGNTSGWKFEGVIKRGTGAASTALVAAVTPTVIAQDAGASAWVVAVTADTTNGGIKVEVTGAAATTIRWVCKIETTEVTY